MYDSVFRVLQLEVLGGRIVGTTRYENPPIRRLFIERRGVGTVYHP